MNKNSSSLYFGIGGILILVAIVLGFFAVGSPLEAQVKRLDERRIQDLSSLSYQLDEHFRIQKKLPATLQDLSTAVLKDFSNLPRDPETGELYGYERLSENRYKLCTTFLRETDSQEQSQAPYYGPMDNWSHGHGLTCFTREIRPESQLFPQSIRVN
ncbi:MAG: hypothetical protein V1908_04470 [Candidatus Peregrinibacteria bacterium]